MGYALIVGGGTDGRYTISLDIGEAERAALVARFTAQEAEAQAKVAAAQVILDEKTALLTAAAAEYNEATEEWIALIGDETSSQEVVGAAYLRYTEAQLTYLGLLTQKSVAQANRNALAFSASRITKALADWEAQVLTETRLAWCADLTETAVGYVATLDIPGESELILIAPGGRQPVLSTDGYFRSRGLMAPWQAYFNAAILPGWQKFKPTYRWGTITALNVDADTASVSLADTRSSAQRLPVNQAATLSNIPVVYMTCNAAAFDVGDRVVVEFQGKNWNAPRVIGFVDNPKDCIEWPATLRVNIFYSRSGGASIGNALVIYDWGQSQTGCGPAVFDWEYSGQYTPTTHRWFTSASVDSEPSGFDASVANGGKIVYEEVCLGRTAANSYNKYLGASTADAITAMTVFPLNPNLYERMSYSTPMITDMPTGYDAPGTCMVLGRVSGRDQSTPGTKSIAMDRAIMVGLIGQVSNAPVVTLTHAGSGRTKEYEIDEVFVTHIIYKRPTN